MSSYCLGQTWGTLLLQGDTSSRRAGRGAGNRSLDRQGLSQSPLPLTPFQEQPGGRLDEPHLSGRGSSQPAVQPGALDEPSVSGGLRRRAAGRDPMRLPGVTESDLGSLGPALGPARTSFPPQRRVSASEMDQRSQSQKDAAQAARAMTLEQPSEGGHFVCRSWQLAWNLTEPCVRSAA